MVTARPETIDQAADIIRGAAGRVCLQICGNGSQYPADCETPGLSSAKLAGIRIYRPDDWTITVGAGTPMAQIIDAISANGQRLAFDPSTPGRMGGRSPEPTIGGAIATNAGQAGPPFHNRVRHAVLGMRFINGKGEIIKAGSRAIKNVAGIDLARGLAGSWGNLALICEVTLWLIPGSAGDRVGAPAPRDSTGAMCLSSRSRTAERLEARIKRAFDPEGVFSSKPYSSRMAS